VSASPRLSTEPTIFSFIRACIYFGRFFICYFDGSTASNAFHSSRAAIDIYSARNACSKEETFDQKG
jgi:hypothetical protein